MRGAELHAKLSLVQQLKTLSKQHEQVLQAFERKVEEKLQEAARQGAGSAGKRMGAPLHAEGPEAKRQRQLAERDNRKKQIWVGTAAAAVLCAVQCSLGVCCHVCSRVLQHNQQLHCSLGMQAVHQVVYILQQQLLQRQQWHPALFAACAHAHLCTLTPSAAACCCSPRRNATPP